MRASIKAIVALIGGIAIGAAVVTVAFAYAYRSGYLNTMNAFLMIDAGMAVDALRALREQQIPNIEAQRQMENLIELNILASSALGVRVEDFKGAETTGLCKVLSYLDEGGFTLGSSAESVGSGVADRWTTVSEILNRYRAPLQKELSTERTFWSGGPCGPFVPPP